MIISNKTYNFIKYLITIFLPSAGALYFALVQIWDFPRIAGVNGTINAVCSFLGMLIGFSSRQYHKENDNSDGELVITEHEGDKYPALHVKDSFDRIESKDKVLLDVVKVTDTNPRLRLPDPQ